MKDDISDVFSETEEESETVETKEEATAETEETTEEETESTVEDDATTTVAEQDEAEPQSDDWTKHAYLDEKRKRQELEDELAKLKEPKEDDTDYLSQSDLKKRVDAEVDLKLKQVIFQDRLQRSYEETSSKYEDYPAMEKAFVAMAEKDQALKEQFESSLNPTEFAYKHAKNHSLLNEYGGDVEKLIQAKLEEAKKSFGLEPEKSKEPVEKPSRTPSLANATESEKNSAPPAKATTLSGLFEDSPY